MVMAIMSSNLDISIPENVSFVGEVGLSGEIRTVTRIEQRVAEAQKLGFETIYIPTSNLKGIKDKFSIKIVEVGRVEDAIRHVFS
jgi:DNA repair protein RadA/Sms